MLLEIGMGELEETRDNGPCNSLQRNYKTSTSIKNGKDTAASRQKTGIKDDNDIITPIFDPRTKKTRHAHHRNDTVARCKTD